MKIVRGPARQIRHVVELTAEVHGGGGEPVRTRLVDLSLDGCKLAGEFRIGEQVEISMQRIGRLMAEVRWSLAGQTGARFVSTRNRGNAGKEAG